MSREWIDVCTDCYYYVEYGKPTDQYDPATQPQPMKLYRDVTDYLFVTGDGVTDFSRQECDGCADPLAGARHEVVLIPKVYDEDEVHQCPSEL